MTPPPQSLFLVYRDDEVATAAFTLSTRSEFYENVLRGALFDLRALVLLAL